MAARLRRNAHGDDIELGLLSGDALLAADDLESQQAEIERQGRVLHPATEAIMACGRACWKDGQTILALNTQIRRIVGRFISEAKKQGLDFESGAYPEPSEPTP